MYFLIFHGIPKPNANDIEGIAGAYINCYIVTNDLIKANKIARKDITKMKWTVLDREEAYEVDEKTISSDGREYYDQALIDKTVYVFHTYPIEEK